jgi:hypothetical protein
MRTNHGDAVYIVTRSHQDYREWCEHRGVEPTGGRHVYVSGVHRLRGLRDAEILFVSGWQERSDWRKVYEIACIVGRRP